jgi:hypothetical protein
LSGPQLNFFTLACADVERMADFLRALGWIEDSASEPAHRLFQGTNGVVVALYAASNYEPHFGPRADGFRGFTLGLNVANAEEVDRVYELLQTVDGAELLEEPFDSPHGFRGSTVTSDGDLTWSPRALLEAPPAKRRHPAKFGGYTGRRPFAGSSNGRTPDSGSGSWGSNPCPAAKEKPRSGGVFCCQS